MNQFFKRVHQDSASANSTCHLLPLFVRRTWQTATTRLHMIEESTILIYMSTCYGFRCCIDTFEYYPWLMTIMFSHGSHNTHGSSSVTSVLSRNHENNKKHIILTNCTGDIIYVCLVTPSLPGSLWGFRLSITTILSISTMYDLNVRTFCCSVREEIVRKTFHIPLLYTHCACAYSIQWLNVTQHQWHLPYIQLLKIINSMKIEAL